MGKILSIIGWGLCTNGPLGITTILTTLHKDCMILIMHTQSSVTAACMLNMLIETRYLTRAGVYVYVVSKLYNYI